MRYKMSNQFDRSFFYEIFPIGNLNLKRHNLESYLIAD